MGVRILLQGHALAPFPGLKPSTAKELEGTIVVPELVA
jgi:hypothetical protein